MKDISKYNHASFSQLHGRQGGKNRQSACFLQLIRPPKLSHGIVALARVSDGFR
jgi:hypothetical protein